MIDTKTMDLIHRIEEHYGSVVAAPESDPDIQKLHVIFPRERVHDEDLDNKIIDYALKGYTISYIISRVPKDASYIGILLRQNGIQLKRHFSYGVVAPDNKKYFVTNLNHFVTTMLHRSRVGSNDQARVYLKARGYKVRKTNKIWNQIPDGVYFLTNYMDQPVVKQGLDSYVYEE